MCQQCQGSGFLPFIKNGEVIAGVRVYCECREDELERYQTITPDAFDFPMSSDFRAWSYNYCGIPDPNTTPPQPVPPEPQEQVIVHRHSDMSKLEFDLLQQTAKRAEYLQKRLDDLRARKKEQEEDHY